jgi:hypothetical protein
MAMTFLSAPPNSTPRTSVLVYTRKASVENASCAIRAARASREATTTAVGCRW